MQNPFTTTFSKIPDNTYIPTEQMDEIIDNFSYINPSESVYKITGVRGSGKTVLLAKVEQEIINGSAGDNWLVCRVTPARDMLQQIAAYLYKAGYADKKIKSRSLNVSANILGSGGGFGTSFTERDDLLDVGTEIEAMLIDAKEKGKRILIGIDEVSKTSEMVVFASEYGKWLRAGYPIYLVCTGLYENIEQLANVKNLTFFRRATTIKTSPLNYIRMCEMYKAQLGVSSETAKTMAAITKGYPYAFQKLGVLYFRQEKKVLDNIIISDLKADLFSYSYEKIWEELSGRDRELIYLLEDGKYHKRAELLAKMSNPDNYSVYRNRLLQRGIITSRQGGISLALPYFGEFVREYGRVDIF